MVYGGKKGNKIGAAKEFSNIVHFESTTNISQTAVAKTVEIEPLEDYAVVIDSIRVVYQGYGGEETTSEIYGIVSVDENQAVVDCDDEDTIFSFCFSKDRTTTGIAQGHMSDQIVYNRGIPTTSRALRLVVDSDNNSLATHELNCMVEYHYEPISREMLRARGI